eukprot:gene8826-6356_t
MEEGNAAAAVDTLIEDLVKSLCDPISLELITDPVVTADGLTYDRQGISEWFDYCRRNFRQITSPTTNRPLSSDTLTPNIAMKGTLDATMRYLTHQDAIGALHGKAKEILQRHREHEREKQLRMATLLEEERRWRALNIFCTAPTRHRLVFQRQHTFPHQYRQQFAYPTVNCDHCSRVRIQEYEACYFHCVDCGNYDLCHACGMHMHENEALPAIEPPSPVAAAAAAAAAPGGRRSLSHTTAAPAAMPNIFADAAATTPLQLRLQELMNSFLAGDELRRARAGFQAFGFPDAPEGYLHCYGCNHDLCVACWTDLLPSAPVTDPLVLSEGHSDAAAAEEAAQMAAAAEAAREARRPLLAAATSAETILADLNRLRRRILRSTDGSIAGSVSREPREDDEGERR